jgi:hypothetical protein
VITTSNTKGCQSHNLLAENILRIVAERVGFEPGCI